MQEQEQEQEEEASAGSVLAVRYQELGLGRLTRRVSQRRRGSLAAHLRSIYLDAQFVHSVVTSYREHGTGRPQPQQQQDSTAFAVFANLRNGAWYLPPEAWDGQVYFKVRRLSMRCGWPSPVDPSRHINLTDSSTCHSHHRSPRTATRANGTSAARGSTCTWRLRRHRGGAPSSSTRRGAARYDAPMCIMEIGTPPTQRSFFVKIYTCRHTLTRSPIRCPSGRRS